MPFNEFSIKRETSFIIFFTNMHHNSRRKFQLNKNNLPSRHKKYYNSFVLLKVWFVMKTFSAFIWSEISASEKLGKTRGPFWWRLHNEVFNFVQILDAIFRTHRNGLIQEPIILCSKTVIDYRWLSIFEAFQWQSTAIEDPGGNLIIILNF